MPHLSGTRDVEQHERLASTGNLTYHGGHVMVGTVTTYAIFWEPPGFYVSPTYNSLILQYFNDVGRLPRGCCKVVHPFQLPRGKSFLKMIGEFASRMSDIRHALPGNNPSTVLLRTASISGA